ncbi:SDR family oxidoreductase [Pelagicoccus mobilis]|uniref:SDR family oxidoreductase n=1 Tax=Pelagicoccus mobilis TaxID=415221 RepID=A0A934VNW9_9BACT|nr:SDR family oxidoreductase [Pelagicoccus mobilis]MBK1876667.1 SDR family oxidoreductase [Pelagicoccus mobilis]
MSNKIENQVAFVTGSNRGIGRAIVETLLARGASKVYAAARDIGKLGELKDKHGDRLIPVQLDVTNPQQIAEAGEVAQDATILINNAGYFANTSLPDGDLETIRAEFEINYFGPLQLTQTFAPILKNQNGGTIVNISSVAGLSNFPAFPTYSDSKAAVHSLTSATRLLLSAQGTQVIGVYPGPVDTDMAKDVDMPKATPESVAIQILDGIEQGTDEVFPDEFAENYRAPYEAGQKTLESRIAQMLQQPA